MRTRILRVRVRELIAELTKHDPEAEIFVRVCTDVHQSANERNQPEFSQGGIEVRDVSSADRKSTLQELAGLGRSDLSASRATRAERVARETLIGRLRNQTAMGAGYWTRDALYEDDK